MSSDTKAVPRSYFNVTFVTRQPSFSAPTRFATGTRTPGRPKITVLKKSGFAAVTGLSLSVCGTNPAYASLIAIDRTHNTARWYTLRNSFNPKPANLVNRGLVARGADWRLHATT